MVTVHKEHNFNFLCLQQNILLFYAFLIRFKDHANHVDQLLWHCIDDMSDTDHSSAQRMAHSVTVVPKYHTRRMLSVTARLWSYHGFIVNLCNIGTVTYFTFK